jgi:hypothetical protein
MTLKSATRTLDPALSELLQRLQPGERIRITQAVRIGSSSAWTTTVEGVFRAVNYLATGLATDRVAEDDIIVVTVHFTKEPHGELSSIVLDEHSRVERLPPS